MTPELLCAVCLHLPPGDTDTNRARAALTIMNGFAVCEPHVECIDLPTDLAELVRLEVEETG